MNTTPISHIPNTKSAWPYTVQVYIAQYAKLTERIILDILQFNAEYM